MQPITTLGTARETLWGAIVDHVARRNNDEDNCKLCIHPDGTIECIHPDYDGIPAAEYYGRTHHTLTVSTASDLDEVIRPRFDKWYRDNVAE